MPVPTSGHRRAPMPGRVGVAFSVLSGNGGRRSILPNMLSRGFSVPIIPSRDQRSNIAPKIGAPQTLPDSHHTTRPFMMANQVDNALSVLGLGQNILELSQEMSKYFQANNLTAPTFALDSPDPPDTPEYRRLHATLKTSLEDLQRLIDGPRKWLRVFCCTGYDLGALQVALDFEFFQLVPAHGEITLEDLAQQAGLDVDRTGRVVRQLMTYRIFEEHRPRVISHSSTSLVLQQDEEVRAVVHYSLDEMLKAAADCNITFKAHPYEAHQNLNPFVTRHGVGMFEFYKNDPEKARRFAKAMAGLRKMDRHLDYLLKDGFNWSAIKGTVVDCGGGNGHISKTLAEVSLPQTTIPPAIPNLVRNRCIPT